MDVYPDLIPLKQMLSADYIVTYFIKKAYVHAYREFVPLKQMPSADRVVTYFNPISTGGGVFHPMPSKWLRTPQRNKLAP